MIYMEYKERTVSHPKIYLFGILIILGWLILRTSRAGRSSETLCKKRPLHL